MNSDSNYINFVHLSFSLTLNTYKNHCVSPAYNYSHENAKNSRILRYRVKHSNGADACCKN